MNSCWQATHREDEATTAQGAQLAATALLSELLRAELLRAERLLASLPELLRAGLAVERLKVLGRWLRVPLRTNTNLVEGQLQTKPVRAPPHPNPNHNDRSTAKSTPSPRAH